MGLSRSPKGLKSTFVMFHLTGAPAGLANISKIISVKAISTKWLLILAQIFDSWKLKANKKVNENDLMVKRNSKTTSRRKILV